MTLTPLLHMPLYLQIHVTCALVSVILGAFVVLRRKRDRLHKITGYIWTVAMAAVALSSFWIREFALIGPFSPIHLLSVLTLWTLWSGIRFAVAGRIRAHRAAFRNLYWYGLLVAGTLNFLPGRRMNQVVFGNAPDMGLWLIGAVAGLALAFNLGLFAARRRRAVSAAAAA
ncbi:DUF2306 domain-containing protein [Gymnodinialimonas sp. 57CJ19]|uniref:DUF2306 domain-containing protein n=1 Tax=Gymnodinialimonas sp. 57CJ19 TaxID=3138498 RepID=UPI0031344B5B